MFDLFKDLEENKEIKSTIEKQNIRVIIGNPPYSAGSKSENDNNQNLSHPKLEKRVYEKYGKNSNAKVGATTRDTLIQSIYMASELLKDKGVLGFVVNGGFIDSKSGDGFRKSVAKDFAHLYVLNLRGNARTSGETFKKEGGKIFDSGSRATIAIIFFVKDASVKNSAIHYYDIGDCLKREEKLNRLAHFSNLDAIPFETIIPNNKGDWINPLYYYDDLRNRHYAISGYALNLFRKHYEDNLITEEEIFYYIYAILHHKGYLEKYKNSLTKEDPRIALSEDFKELSILGKELAKLHLNYESGEMHASVEYKTLINAEEKGYYDVETMTKTGDRINYNNHIAITKIPKKAFDYVVNGKSAIDWVIERYKKTTDKDSLIENNPNDYKDGKYVFELLCRVIKLSEKSVDLIEKISEKRFE